MLFCYDDRKTTPAETRDQAKSAARNVAICGLALAPLAAQMLTPFLERWTARKPPSAREARIADGRADPYPPAIWQTYAKITFLHPGWRAAIDANHIDSVLVKVGSALDQGMARRPEWRAFAVDRNYRLWIRRPRSYAVSRLTPP
ncbi:MAG: hypothetical protein ACREM6_16000, partial [Vulcanimicrobiaceae bacterium]